RAGAVLAAIGSPESTASTAASENPERVAICVPYEPDKGAPAWFAPPNGFDRTASSAKPAEIGCVAVAIRWATAARATGDPVNSRPYAHGVVPVVRAKVRTGTPAAHLPSVHSASSEPEPLLLMMMR